MALVCHVTGWRAVTDSAADLRFSWWNDFVGRMLITQPFLCGPEKYLREKTAFF